MATAPISSWDAIHPVGIAAFAQLWELLQKESGDTVWMMFETYRSPERQNELFRKKKTKAKAWESAHQYGLAIDFVPVIDGKPFWPAMNDDRWVVLNTLATECGLGNDIAWDPAHVYHPAFLTIKKAL